MKIKFYVENIYGQNRAVLIHGEHTKTIRQLTGRKSLTVGEMRALTDFNLEFEQTYKPNEFPAIIQKEEVTVS